MAGSGAGSVVVGQWMCERMVFSDGARRPRLGLDAGDGASGGSERGFDLMAQVVGECVPATVGVVVVVSCHDGGLGQIAGASRDVVDAPVDVHEGNGAIGKLGSSDALAVIGVETLGVEGDDFHLVLQWGRSPGCSGWESAEGFHALIDATRLVHKLIGGVVGVGLVIGVVVASDPVGSVLVELDDVFVVVAVKEDLGLAVIVSDSNQLSHCCSLCPVGRCVERDSIMNFLVLTVKH